MRRYAEPDEAEIARLLANLDREVGDDDPADFAPPPPISPASQLAVDAILKREAANG
jgi:hypothetical protein